jgi:SOUL heme-binding protein
VYETRPEGLERLARYFDGANAAGARLPPTQPLITRYEPQPDGSLAKWMELRVADSPAPQPAEGLDVQLFVSGGEALAVRDVFGTVTPELAEKARRELVAVLSRDGLRCEDGPFCLAAYGPLYSLSERRNELWVRVLT